MFAFPGHHAICLVCRIAQEVTPEYRDGIGEQQGTDNLRIRLLEVEELLGKAQHGVGNGEHDLVFGYPALDGEIRELGFDGEIFVFFFYVVHVLII